MGPRGTRSSKQQSGRNLPGPSVHGHVDTNVVGSTCGNCGFILHRQGVCPARNVMCSVCKKRGHYQRCCRSTRHMSNVHTVEMRPGRPQPSDNGELSTHGLCDEDHFLNMVLCNDDREPWYVSLNVNDNPIKFKVDSGADKTIITEHVYDSMRNTPQLVRTDDHFWSITDNVECMGRFTTTVNYKGCDVELTIHVIKGACSNLLARGTCQAMGLLYANLNEIGLLNTEPVHITLTEGTVPHHVSTALRVPIPLIPKVEAELERLQQEGIIQKVTEPTDWCSPMVVTMKKSGELRICVDLRQLNKVVQREHYTLEDITQKLSGCDTFSALDATGGYNQIPVDGESMRLTTFIMPVGRFCYKRLPFGLSSASEIFQRKMIEAIGERPGVACYQDDVIVAGKSQKHDKRLKEVMHTLTERGLRLNLSKCRFRKRFGLLVYWGLTLQQQPGSYQGGEMMKSVFFWWRKPEYPEETTDLRQVTKETFHPYGLCPVRGLNLGCSSVKQSELRRDESGALAHRKRELEFLGHVFTKDGMKPDSAKIQVIRDLAPPTDVRELRRIMGTVTFLGKYVPHLSSVAKPMTYLLCKDRAWTWDSLQQQAFEDIKTLKT